MKIAPPRYVGYGRVPDGFCKFLTILGRPDVFKARWVPLVGFGQRRKVPREQMFSASPPRKADIPSGHPRSLTCAGLGLKLRNLTPDYKFCSHVAFRGALGYRGTLRCRR